MSKPLAVVLAAGKGTRMASDLPKVLCEVRGRPLIAYVLDALQTAGIDRILVVVGYREELVRETLAQHANLEFVSQHEQLGTGHAVMMCRRQIAQHDGPVLVLTGDSPLTQVSSLTKLLEEFQAHQPACLLGTLIKDDPQGLGRILRGPAGEFLGIVEEKDATEAQQQIREVNMSTYIFQPRDLLDSLDQLDNDNRQAEYYLTDCPGLLLAAGKEIRALAALQPCEALSVNNVEELALVEAEMIKMGY